MKTFDLIYINAGLFTRFIPNTPAGEEAYRVMHEQQGDASILSIHVQNVIAQLRKAGYSVAKSKKAKKVTVQEIDELLAALEA